MSERVACSISNLEVHVSLSALYHSCKSMGRTFLPLVEDRRARVVYAFLFIVFISFAAAFVNALFRHIEGT